MKTGYRVLGMGCGAGTKRDALISFGLNGTAGEFSANAVHMINAEYGNRLCGTDCFDMREGFPYADGSFDAVISDLSLHYFSWNETERIIGEIRRILAPKGLLIARLHSTRNSIGADAQKIEDGYFISGGYPRRYFTPEEIRNLFAGWRLCSLEEKTIHRYARQKYVIEFTAQKP